MKKRQKSKKNQLFIENILEPPTLRSTSFAKAYPEAARQWHFKRNCGFGPEDFSHGSTVRCWFKCPAGKDHIFQSPLHTVARAWKDGSWSQACPFCRGLKPSITNSLASLYPELVPQWMTRKNSCNPEDIPLGSRLKAWWIPGNSHWDLYLLRWSGSLPSQQVWCIIPKVHAPAASHSKTYTSPG